MTTTRRRSRVDPRVRDRQRAVAAARRGRRRRRTAAVVGVVAVVAVLVAVARSPLFEVASVEVAGVDGPRAAQVHDRLRSAMGRPLASVDRDARAEQLTTLPWVRTAEVRRRLPGTVVARIEPREPVVVVETDAGRWAVDADAVVVDDAPEEAGDLLVVRGGPAVVAPPGERVRDDTVREAVGVAVQLPDRLAAQVVAIEAPRPRALTLELDRGVTARVGSAERLEAKLDALVLVLDDLAQRGGGELEGIAEIDVRAPANPTVSRSGDLG